MSEEKLYRKCISHMNTLCNVISDRCVGSNGNRQATGFFENELSLLGWNTEMVEFDAIDWEENGASLQCGEKDFKVLVSPYSNGFKGEAKLAVASTVIELEKIDAKDRIILLRGDIAREQLMPKNFIFYNPEEHQKIIALLEKSGAKAIICATSRNAALAGGVYPFPLIEDGDFDIPSVFMTDIEGERLAPLIGEILFLESESRRIPGKGYNVIARKGNGVNRIVVTAHIDAKKGTPGAIDNASGVVILLLLAELLKDFNGGRTIEIVAFNGEDYYAVPGQMNYIAANQGKFNDIFLNINVDGAGYKVGPTAFSLFDLDDKASKIVHDVIGQYTGIVEGIQWPQGDHSIFLYNGVPAIAVSSKWFIDNISEQDITHTSRDNVDIVDCGKVVEIAYSLDKLIRNL